MTGPPRGATRPDISSTSGELQAIVRTALEALHAVPTACALQQAPEAVRDSLPVVFGASEFVAQACVRDPQLLGELIAQGDLQRSLSAEQLAARSPAVQGDAFSETHLLGELRSWRRRELVRIAWRDLAGWASVEETLADLTAFADAAIRVACDIATRPLVARYGAPRSANGEIQSLVVVGMGKLGGGELNFSSDVDLVFLFPEHGETDGSRPIANEEFFTRLGQGLIRLLEAPTHDGFVLRVDMRLRPFGDSGPLVASFASFEDYLPRHGRDWERYAYVKARPITSQERYGEIQASSVRPFVYRRYLDFGVFESLREMKALIAREVERRELAGHVKLGPGGIREIEFIVQSFQLIRGGRSRRLQGASLLKTLAMLAEERLLPATVVADLRAAYLYLRRLENHLQMLNDAQVHQLPEDLLSRERIALGMGACDWAALLTELNGHRDRVSSHFRTVVFGGTDAGSGTLRIDLGRFWDTQAETAALVESLMRAGFAHADEATRLLLELRASSLVRRLDEAGRKRLQALLPVLLADIAGGGDREADRQIAVLRRILRMIEAIGQRSAYFSLLQESAGARRRLVELCGHGDFLAQQIASHPLLLDELLDERLLSELPGRVELARELALRMEQAQDEEPEHQVEALCHFQRAAIFRVAVADLTGRLPVMQVSDRLTDIAELILECAMDLGWRQMTAQFGVPYCGEAASRRPVRIAAAAYGKLGGIELGYSSDLDLVFLHDSTGEHQETDAPRPIDNQVFFVRIAQRIVHLLTMHSSAGRLYEVDVRLRPSGKGGLLVTSIRAFSDYQRREAWTWEHQALLHARAVAGAPQLRAEFEKVRLDVLCNDVRRETLRSEVRAMRERMRKELSRASDVQFDIKQDAGGVADIEFMAQFWALNWAQSHPAVAMFSDAIRQLESVASADLIPQETVDVLTNAYRGYRTRIHHLSLAGQPPLVGAGEFVSQRAAVMRIWSEAMED
ncbi:MAG TPA: bifunctional [glutamate--ammonia ligase]-adenylyl-L-tyrosine phosphorylase/[glutamate--ammonia-ligase] adenylyltransferase [Steroidobacteraceae bacterium]